jgi:hypothetical protein
MRGSLALVLLAAQLGAAPAPAAAQAGTAPNVPLPLPERMRLCGVACFDLARVQDHYEVVSDGKVTSTYTVESFTPDSVVLHRTDAGGGTATLRGSMTGELTRVVNGEAEWLTPRHARGPFQLSWGAQLAAAQVPPLPIDAALAGKPPPPAPLMANTATGNLPPLIHVCAQICMTLEPRDGRYVSTSHNGWDPPGFHSLWAFESFTPQSVIVHRYDAPHMTNPGGLALDVTYAGQMSADGTQLVNPTINGQPVTLSMGWGASLAAVPGNDEEMKRFADARWHQLDEEHARKVHAQRVAFAMPVPAACQANPAGSSPAASAGGLHLALCECEMPDCPGADAAIWTIDGKEGSALWAGWPTIADLSVERFDAGGILIRRYNRSSNKPGLSAVYTGTLKGNEITGMATWSWYGFKGGAVQGPWHAWITNAAQQAVLVQYQKDVEEAVVRQRWGGLLDTLKVAGAVGGAAADPTTDDIPTLVHQAVYDGPERREHPR